MQIPSVGQSGYQLLQRSQQQAAQSADEIATAVVQDPKTDSQLSETSMNTALVNLNQAEHYNRVGVKVLEAEDSTLGSLLDIQV